MQAMSVFHTRHTVFTDYARLYFYRRRPRRESGRRGCAGNSGRTSHHARPHVTRGSKKKIENEKILPNMAHAGARAHRSHHDSPRRAHTHPFIFYAHIVYVKHNVQPTTRGLLHYPLLTRVVFHAKIGGKSRERASPTPSPCNGPEFPCLRCSSLPRGPSTRHMIVHGS